MKELIEAIKNRDSEKLRDLIKLYGLEIDYDNMKLKFNNREELKKKSDYWNIQQYVRKILLNSLYGAILNENCIFYDKRIGQSVTLTGRLIMKFMSEKINEIITGEKDHLGDAIVYGDTDSVDGDSIVYTNYGAMTIKDLYENCKIKWNMGEKYYGCDDNIKILSYDERENDLKYYNFNYVYKHDVEKDMFLVEDDNGNKVLVTEDHSIMIEDNSNIREMKPCDLKEGMLLITITNEKVTNDSNNKKQ
ncbi:MAG: DNA polymerase domain-containing protein [Candidatus Aenigmatarchaeota archaeon]